MSRQVTRWDEYRTFLLPFIFDALIVWFEKSVKLIFS